MPAIGFMTKFEPMITGGRKVLTMRVPRKDGRFPAPMDSPSPLRLYVGMRTVSCRLILEVERPVVAATVGFDETGYRWSSTWADHGAPSAAGLIAGEWRKSRDAVQFHRDVCNETLAIADGFDSWPDLWAWHLANKSIDSRGVVTRDLVGWA